MWGAMSKMASGAMSAVGLGPSGEKVPFDCAWPNPDVTDARVCMALLEKHHAQFCQYQEDKEWGLIDGFKDPDGGDMHMWTRPAYQTYQCVKATFSIPDTKPAKVVDLLYSADMKVRGAYSADCTALNLIDEPTAMSSIITTTYWAPPPVASRDFVFLVGKREHEDGTMDLWGCSVQHADAPETYSIVRGASLWGWRLTPVGDHCLASYTNCFDPRGWTPTWVLSWMKTTCAKELAAVRAVCTGQKVNLEKTSLEDAGVDAEKAKAEAAAHEKEAKA